LTVTFGGTGGGTVLVFENSDQCTSSCMRTFPVGTKIHLFGAGDSASQFSGFAGDCVGSSCPLTMDIDHSVTAVFTSNSCTPNTSTCDKNTNVFTRCDGNGMVAETRACPLGCNSGAPRCNEVNPSNGLAAALDMYDALPANQKVAANLPDGSKIDTSAKTIKDGGGATINLPTTTITQSGAPDIFVVMVKSWQSGNVVVDGTRAFAIVSDGDVAINGVLQLDAHDDGFPLTRSEGPGSVTTCDASNGLTSGGDHTGGGGGGHGTDGAKGGDSGVSLGGNGSTQQNDAAATPLRGGCRGGTGSDGAVFNRGRGGGAIQIVSRTQVVLGSTGVVSANATGGGGSLSASGDNAGGGAGGTILLEAPIVTMGSASIFAANGGGGGCTNGLGNPGQRSSTPATGCSPSVAGGKGGDGGAGASGPQVGTANASNGGGGGGAYGRVRINTAQTFMQGSATISPTPSLGTLGAR
jgi:hypothetical protein